MNIYSDLARDDERKHREIVAPRLDKYAHNSD